MKNNKYSKNGAETPFAERPYLIDWTIQNLPAAYNFYITDADMIIRDRQGNLMIIEVKCHKGVVPENQKITYKMLDALIRKGLTNDVGTVVVNQKKMKVQYKGFWVMQFEKTRFDNGKVYINGKRFTESEVIKFLSFEKTYVQILRERAKAA